MELNDEEVNGLINNMCLTWNHGFGLMVEPERSGLFNSMKQVYWHCFRPLLQKEYTAMTAMTKQEGGDHYKDMAIQPVEFIHRNGIGYMEGCAIKYLSRWKKKGGVLDLRKAIHFIELLIQFEEGTEQTK
jgi:hypothetical protein